MKKLKKLRLNEKTVANLQKGEMDKLTGKGPGIVYTYTGGSSSSRNTAFTSSDFESCCRENTCYEC